MKSFRKNHLQLQERVCANPLCMKEFTPRMHKSITCSGKCWAFVKARNKKSRALSKVASQQQLASGDVVEIKCVACGETDVRTLAINHIHNDGHIDRKINKVGSGYNMHTAVLNNKVDLSRLELLCANCNMIVQAEAEFKESRKVIEEVRMMHGILPAQETMVHSVPQSKETNEPLVP